MVSVTVMVPSWLTMMSLTKDVIRSGPKSPAPAMPGERSRPRINRAGQIPKPQAMRGNMIKFPGYVVICGTRRSVSSSRLKNSRLAKPKTRATRLQGKDSIRMFRLRTVPLN